MSTRKEKLQVTALVLAFPVLMAAAYAIYLYNQRYKPQRKRLAKLDEAEMGVGCDVGREKWGDPW